MFITLLVWSQLWVNCCRNHSCCAFHCWQMCVCVVVVAALRSFKGHKAGVACMDWHPYMQQHLATGAGDTLVKVGFGRCWCWLVAGG